MSSARRGRRSWGQRTVLGLCSVFVVGLLLAAGGLGYTYSKYSRLARVQLGTVLTEAPASDEPQNILLVGVDSAADLDPDDPVSWGRDGGLRSDSMMILRVDPAADTAHLLSIPRDLWVPLPSGGRQRINTAIQLGGPPELIQTIHDYFGIPINHYAQVDFAAFQDLVGVVDGVDVWFDHPARDRHSGLYVEEPGCVRLEPRQALAYVRARHLETRVDGRWRTDPTGDLGRMSRQQDFIVRALRRAISRGARNPVTLDRLIDAGLAAVSVDDQWRAEDMASLARRFRLFDPDRLQRHALPVSDDTIGGAAVLRLRDREAQPILDLFRGTPTEGAPTPADIRVSVLNGTGRSGEAGATSDALAAVGFTTVGTGEAEQFGFDRTVVRHEAGQAAAADLVARYLEAGAVLEEVEGPLPADVVVVTGADFDGVRAEPVPSTSTTTTTAPAGASTSTTAPPPTTSTTAIGLVPEPPPGVDC